MGLTLGRSFLQAYRLGGVANGSIRFWCGFFADSIENMNIFKANMSTNRDIVKH